jgi:O-antigen/teichoic acid export membrane protein
MGSDNNRGFLVKSALKMIGSQYCLSIFNILCYMYLFRVLSHIEIAIIAIFEILTSIYRFSEMGINSVMIKLCPSRLKADNARDKALGLIRLTLYVQGFILLLMVTVTFYYAPIISNQFLKTHTYSWAIIIIAPGSAFTILFTTLRGVAQVVEKYTLIAKWIFLAGVLKQGIAISCFLINGFKGYLIALTCASVIPVIGIGFSIRHLLFNPSPVAPLWETFIYGIPLFIRSFMRYGFKELDQMLIGLLLTPEILATYSVARRFINYLNQIIEFFATPIMVRSLSLIDSPITEIQNFSRQAMRYFYLIIIPVCICFSLASPWLMAVYGGVKYFLGWPILSLMAICQILYSFISILSIYVFALKLPKSTLILDSSIGLCNYCFSPFFIIIISVYGVIFGQMISFILGIFVATYMLRSYNISIHWSELSILVWPLILSVFVVLTGMYLSFNLCLIPLYFMIAAVIFIVTLSKNLNDNDWEHIRDVCPQKITPIIEYLFHKR